MSYEEIIELNGKKYMLETEVRRKTVITEPCSVMGIVKVEEKDGKLLAHTFEYEKKPCLIAYSGEEKDVFFVFKDYKIMGKYTREFLEKASKVLHDFDLVKKEDVKVYTFGLNQPILIWGGNNVGLVLAPRVDSEMDELAEKKEGELV